jgi:uncharacterized protein YcaQ
MRGRWGGWGAGKRAMEYLFRVGRVTVAHRRNFERVYDLPSRVLPPSVLSAVVPSEHDARRELLRRACVALGVFTLADVADYWRMQSSSCRAPFRDLVDSGDVVPVVVEGWDGIGAGGGGAAAFMSRDAVMPRRRPSSDAGVLLSPFDPLLWQRKRTLRMFGFHYRIEIYVPAPKREYGYYVLPFLQGDRFTARVDLKADRATGRLVVHGAWSEPGSGVTLGAVADALSAELLLVADWLGLTAGISVGRRGDLAPLVRRSLAGTVT